MSRPTILVNGHRPPPLGAAEDGEVAIGTTAALTLESTSGITSVVWAFEKVPVGSTAAPSPTTGLNAQATFDLAGEYILTCRSQSGRRDRVVLRVYTAAKALLPLQPEDSTETMYEALDRLTEAVDGWPEASIADGAVVSAKIADEAVTDAKVEPTGGLGTFLRTMRRYTPLGNASDSASIAALFALPLVEEVGIGAGTAVIQSTIDLKSSKTILMHPNTVLSSTMSSGSFDHFILGFLPTLSGSGTLSSSASAGANQVASATSFTVGDWVWIGQTAGSSTYVAGQYQILAKSGVGPYTYTLDRPLTRAWNSGTYIRALTSRLKDCVIEGNGALLEGGGDRLLQIQGGWHCLVRGVRFAKTASYTPDYGLAWDLGCYECSAVDCSADNTANGAIIEAGERVDLVRFNVRGGGVGLRVNDSTDCAIVDCHASGYTSAGVSVTANATGGASSDASAGSARISIRGGTFQKSSAGTGVSLASYAIDCHVEGVVSADNDINFDVGPTTARTTLANCTSERAALGTYGYGFYLHGPGIRVVAPTSRGDKFAFYVAGSGTDSVEIVAPEIKDYTTRALSIDTDPTAGSWLSITGGGRITSTTNTDAIDLRGPMNLLLADVRIDLPSGGPIGIYHRNTAGAAVCVLRNVQMSQGGAGASGYAQQASSTNALKIEGNTYLNVTTPTTIQATGFISRGTVTCNGTTGVDVNYPIRATDQVILTRKTDGGTPGATPRVTITAGTKFTINGTAGDTSVYSYAIV